MTGQIVAALIVALAVFPIGWLVRREAKRAKARRDLDAALAELRARIAAAQLAIGLTMLPAFAGLARAAKAAADWDAQWQKIMDATR